MYSLIFSITFLVCAILALLIGFLTGKKYKWQYSVVKIVITAISACVAFFVPVLLALVITKPLISLLFSSLGEISVVKDISLISGDVIAALVCVIVAPLLYYPTFAITRGFLNIVKKPIARLLVKMTENTDKDGAPSAQKAQEEVADFTEAAESEAVEAEVVESVVKISKKEEKKLRRLAKKNALRYGRFSPLGALLGSLCGLLTFFVISVPIVCGLSYIATPAAALTQNKDDGTGKIIHEISIGASNNLAVAAMKYTGGEAIFNNLTTTDLGGNEMSLKRELDFATDCIEAVNAIINTPEENYNGEAVAQSLRDAGEGFSETTLLPTLIPEVFKLADEKWDNGEKLFFIGKPSLGETFDKLIEPALDVLVSETPETIKVDLPVIIESAADVAEKYPLSTFKSEPISIITDEEVATKIFTNLLENDRLYVIVPSIAEYGMTMLCDSLKLRTDVAEMYNSMLDELCVEVNTFVTENTDPVTPAQENGGAKASKDETPAQKLAKKLTTVFNNNGINISADSAVAISEKALVKFADANATSESMALWLAETEIVLKSDDATSAGNTITITDTQAFAKNTQIVDMNNFEVKMIKVSDPRREAALYAHSFKIFFEIFDKITTDNVKMSSIIADIGPILNDFNAMETIGPANTSILLLGILQSEKVTDNINMSMTEIYDIGSHINDKANTGAEQNEAPKYDNLMTGLSNTITVIESVKNNDSKDITDENVKTLIDDLTPESASTIEKIATPSLMENYGVPETKSETTSDLISGIFNNLSTTKENAGLTEEEIKEEAAAVSEMMNIAINVSSSKGENNANRVFESKDKDDTVDGDGAASGEEKASSTGITAADFVDRITDSTVVSDTLKEKFYAENTEEIESLINENVLTEEDRIDIVDAFNSKLDEKSEDEKAETGKTLVSIANLLGINVQIGADGKFTLVTTQA